MGMERKRRYYLLPAALIRSYENCQMKLIFFVILNVQNQSVCWISIWYTVCNSVLVIQTELSLITLHWFLTSFASVVDIRLLLRIWDLLFYQGSLVLFQVTLGMLKIKVFALHYLFCECWLSNTVYLVLRWFFKNCHLVCAVTYFIFMDRRYWWTR